MKRKQKIFATGLLCVAVGFVVSGYFSIPGAEVGPLSGKLLHPGFSPTEFGEVFFLTFVLSFAVARFSFRSNSHASSFVFSLGLGIFAVALLVLEARIQSYGPLVEAVIKGRFGPKPVILLVASAVGVFGLLIAWNSIRLRSKRYSRGDQIRKKGRGGRAKSKSAKKKSTKKKVAKKKRSSRSTGK